MYHPFTLSISKIMNYDGEKFKKIGADGIIFNKKQKFLRLRLIEREKCDIFNIYGLLPK